MKNNQVYKNVTKQQLYDLFIESRKDRGMTLESAEADLEMIVKSQMSTKKRAYYEVKKLISGWKPKSLVRTCPHCNKDFKLPGIWSHVEACKMTVHETVKI